jgi:hypothetical protein
MGKATTKAKSRAKQQQVVERDDDASDPYSDEINVSSPEFLEMGDDGEVVANSDWTEKPKGKKTKAKAGEAEQEDDVDEDGEEVRAPNHLRRTKTFDLMFVLERR